MRAGKPITVDGIEYRSLNAAARAHGLPKDRVRFRLKQGYSIKKAFSQESFLHDRQITFDGVVYSSINKAARAHGLKPITVHVRLGKGWPLERVFSAQNQDKSPITVNQVSYPSITAAANAYGVNMFTFYGRLRRGWSPEQAAEIHDPPETPKPSGRRVPITVQGKDFETIAEACRYFGVKASAVYDRINILGWTIEQAFEIDKSRLRTGTPGATYVITNKNNGKQYVELTLRSIDERLKVLFQYTAKGKGSKASLAEAIRKDGHAAFSVDLLQAASTFEEMRELEKYFIEKLDTRV